MPASKPSIELQSVPDRILGPLMTPFVDQLASLCTAHPTRAKWVIVSTHGVGRMMGDRLALAGTNWANLRFVTPLDLALRMGAPFLVERGVDPSEEGLGPALMMRLLLDLPTDASYFRPLADQPQMAVALWTTLRELRMAGVRATDLTGATFSSPAKHEELAGLLASYEQFLETNNRGDRATVFQEALAHRDWCPVLPHDCWVEWPGAIWSPLERRLLDGLPGERIAPHVIAVAGIRAPRRLGSAVVAPEGPPMPRASIEFFQAGGAEAEIEEVFRRILAKGARLDDVEIACGSSSYASLVWEKALRYDWPVTLAAGVPATLTRPGRALLGLIEWIEDDFSAGLLRRLLESGDVRLGPATSDIPAGRAARLLVRARAAWGRRTYRLSIARLAKAERARATRDDVSPDERDRYLRYATDADALARAIDAIIALVPETDARGDVDAQALARGARTFLETNATRTSALDAAAATAIDGALAELDGLGNFRCPIGQALRFIRERVEGVTIGADRARPGHLYVSHLSQAGLPHRRQLFVVGLEEGRVFPPVFEDPILLDDERRGLHDGLALSTDRTDEAVYAATTRLAEVLASTGVNLCLSYSCRDVRQFRDTYASWLLLNAYRKTSGNPQARYSDLHQAMGTPVSVVPRSPDAAPSLGRWWLHGVTRSEETEARAAVFAQYPALRAGAFAARERQSDRFTEFDGHVPAAGPALDPAAAGVVVSPTRLEGAAKCGFRYFLERGLGVRAIESGERSRDVWLDPLIRGSLLHDLYAACLRRSRAEGRRAAMATDREWLLGEARRTLADLKAEMPPPSGDVEQRETADLLADLDLFLADEESLDPGREPLGFEVSFGYGVDGGDGEVLASAAPIEITAGNLTFRVTGRVDRVDRIDTPHGPEFHIVDYKTGSFWKEDYTGTFAGGRLLQHALYGLAVAELLKRAKHKGRVAGAEYYFSSAKGRQHRQPIPAPPAADVARVLADLREVIVSGLFVHAPEDRACKFCDYQHACGRDAHERVTMKQGDAALAAVRRLASHG
jgi:hypothetical protein